MLRNFDHARRVGVALGGSSVIAAAVLLTGVPVVSATTLKTFSVHGYYKWTVPRGITSVLFDVYGASGGNVTRNVHGQIQIVAFGGSGGEAKGRFKVKPGQVLEIDVGGAGSNSNSSGAQGGLNGGGDGESTSNESAAGGGGASDVAIGGKGNTCASGRICQADDRIIVGGGGGGAAYGTAEGDGLPGGGLNGGSSASGYSDGGGQEAVYTIYGCPTTNGLGCFGFGGGYDIPPTVAQAGGGGGWYGGDASSTHFSNEGGSGGSGYISPLATSSSFPGGSHVGDGLVVITT